MTALYILIATLALAGNVFFLSTAIRREPTLNAVLGWICGFAYFNILPLFIFALNRGYRITKWQGGSGYWTSFSLTGSTWLGPFFTIEASALFAILCVTLPRFQRRKNRPTKYIDAAIDPRIRRVLFASVAIAAIAFIIQGAMYGGISAFLHSNWYSRNDQLIADSGVIAVILLSVMNAAVIVFDAAAILYLTKPESRWQQWVSILGMLAVITVVSGNRIYIFYFLIGIFVRLWQQHRKKTIIILVLSAPVLAAAAGAWSFTRGVFNTRASDQRIAAYQSLWTTRQISPMSVFVDATEGADVMLAAHIIRDFGSRYQYLNGATLYRVLTFFIPRSVYPERSQNFTVLAGEIYEPGTGVSLNATLIGELWANVGLFSFPLLGLYSLIIGVAVSKMVTNSVLQPTVAFLYAVSTVRVTFAEGVIGFLITLLLAVALEKTLLRATIPNSISSASLPRVVPTLLTYRDRFTSAR